MTYSETKGQDVFDWNAFLSKTTHGIRDIRQAVCLAAQWITCACGNLCAELPREPDGCPIDEELTQLGRLFSQQISKMLHDSRARVDAKRTLIQIERRSKILLELINQR